MEKWGLQILSLSSKKKESYEFPFKWMGGVSLYKKVPSVLEITSKYFGAMVSSHPLMERKLKGKEVDREDMLRASSLGSSINPDLKEKGVRDAQSTNGRLSEATRFWSQVV